MWAIFVAGGVVTLAVLAPSAIDEDDAVALFALPPALDADASPPAAPARGLDTARALAPTAPPAPHPERVWTPRLSVGRVLADQPDATAGPARSRPTTTAGEYATDTVEPPTATDIEPVPATPANREVGVEVAAGDTLMGMLLRLGIARAEAHAAIEGLRDVYDPRRLRPGQRLEIETEAATSRLVRIAFAPSGRERIELVRDEASLFEAHLHERATVIEEHLAEARVRTSLHAAASAAGMPEAVFAQIVKIFSWDVDFQRETRAGDRLTVLFERERVPAGPVVGAGAVRYARLDIGGRTLEAFRFERDGDGAFFSREGDSLRRFLLRTPVSSGRMSSGFGMRRHPILGYTRMHRGVDFAAPTGTPVYAAGHGRIARVGRLGGYGNYIRIDHGSAYATAYAHLSRFAEGLHAGDRVRQGDVIGYVGSTGRSTGPHLHFEVLKHGEQVDPLKVARPPAARLEGAQLAAFERRVRAIETRLADLGTRSFAGETRRRGASDG